MSSPVSRWFSNDKMTAELNINILEHLQRQTSCTKDNSIVILCSTYKLQISIWALNYRRDNGIICRHATIGCQRFGSFKSKLKIDLFDWNIRWKNLIHIELYITVESSYVNCQNENDKNRYDMTGSRFRRAGYTLNQGSCWKLWRRRDTSRWSQLLGNHLPTLFHLQTLFR